MTIEWQPCGHRRWRAVARGLVLMVAPDPYRDGLLWWVMRDGDFESHIAGGRVSEGLTLAKYRAIEAARLQADADYRVWVAAMGKAHAEARGDG